MPDFANPYDAVIADLEAKRAEIDHAIQLMKRIKELGSVALIGVGANMSASATVVPGGAVDLSTIPSDAFFKMTIADASVKFLNIWANRKPQPTNTIIEALERGGFDRKAYQTVYGILNRRAKQEKDVVNVKGDWGLAEWYGGGGSKTTKRRVISIPKSSLVPPSEPEAQDENEETETPEPEAKEAAAAQAQL